MIQDFSLMIDVISAAFVAAYFGKLMFEQSGSNSNIKRSLLGQRITRRSLSSSLGSRSMTEGAGAR